MITFMSGSETNVCTWHVSGQFAESAPLRFAPGQRSVVALELQVADSGMSAGAVHAHDGATVVHRLALKQHRR